MHELPYILRCINGVSFDGLSYDFNLHVLTAKAVPVERFEMMCEAIDNDISFFPNAGEDHLEAIRKVEAGETDYVQADGNAWVAHITRDKVWFEDICSLEEGGEVSLAQYKLAVETYSRFASDPERKPIEVIFPDVEAKPT
jgi:hypothetical protein